MAPLADFVVTVDSQKKRNRIKNVLGILLTPIVLYLLLRLFEYAQVYKPRIDLIASPQDIHPTPEDVTLVSGTDYRLHAWYFSALNETPWSKWVVLISHGNGGNISYRLDQYQLWLEAGFNVMAYDYRGYGQSSGLPTEHGTYEDATSAYRWLVETKGFAPERTIALGESLGGAVATELACRHPVGGLVLQSTFTRIVDIGKELFPFLPVETISAIRYDTRSKLPSLPMPKLILHSQTDSMIAYHHAERNFEACAEPKLLREIIGDHNDGVRVTAELYRQYIEEFKELLTQGSKPDNDPPVSTKGSH